MLEDESIADMEQQYFNHLNPPNTNLFEYEYVADAEILPEPTWTLNFSDIEMLEGKYRTNAE